MILTGAIENSRTILVGPHSFEVVVTSSGPAQYRAWWRRAHWKDRSWVLFRCFGATTFETHAAASNAILQWIEDESLKCGGKK